MEGIFLKCTILQETPAIPNGVTNLTSSFTKTAITTMPEIPNSVTIMFNTFGQCAYLKNITKLPNNLENLGMRFHSCTSLEVAPDIPKKVTNMSHTFYSCTSLKNVPEIPEGVVDMSSCFQLCTSLNSIDVRIPSSVKNLNSTFREDSNISGKIVIDAIPDNYGFCFSNACTTENKELIVSGPEENRQILTNIIATKFKNLNIKGDWE